MPAGPGFQRSPPTSSSPGPASAPDLQPPCGASARHPELSAPGRQRGSARTCPRGPGRGQLHPSRRASTDGPDPCVRSTLALAPSDRGSGRSSRQPLPLAPAAKPSRGAAVPALSFRSVTQRDLIKNCPQKPSASSREKTSPPTAGRISTTGRRPRGTPGGSASGETPHGWCPSEPGGSRRPRGPHVGGGAGRVCGAVSRGQAAQQLGGEGGGPSGPGAGPG